MSELGGQSKPEQRHERPVVSETFRFRELKRLNERPATGLDSSEPNVAIDEAAEAGVGQGGGFERLRWAEHPANEIPERYSNDPETDRRVAALYSPENPLLACEAVNIAVETDPMDRTQNCAECARSVADILDGFPHSADAFDPGEHNGESLSNTEVWAQRSFNGPRDVPEGLVELSRSVENGGHSIVAVEWKTLRERYTEQGNSAAIEKLSQTDDGLAELDVPSGHAFNAAWVGDEVVLIDGQIGVSGPLVDGVLTKNVLANAKSIRWMQMKGKDA